MGGRGESVIDYVMGDEEVREMISELKVADRVDSDHFPLVVRIKDGRRGVGGGNGRAGARWDWSQEGKRVFKEKLESIWDERREGWRGDWRELKEDIQEVLREGQGGREKKKGLVGR